MDSYTDQGINVIGLPTSPNQREVRYSLKTLSATVEETKRLQVRLYQLRKQWPL